MAKLLPSILLTPIPSQPAEQYVRVARIGDPDDPTTGASNVGLFLVRRPSDQLLLVEKRMPRDRRTRRLLFLDEIRILSKLRHPNIIAYIDAYIRTPPPTPRAAATGNAVDGQQQQEQQQQTQRRWVQGPPVASLYIEYCSGGSLGAILRWVEREVERTGAGEASCVLPPNSAAARDAIEATTPRLPEAFLWHVFISLARALVYIFSGHTRAEDVVPVCKLVPGWRPLLHRDVQPHNVFLRQPVAAAATAAAGPGTGATYPEVVLGDFGTAIPYGHPDLAQQQQQPFGTIDYQGPEHPAHDMRGRSDVYGAGTIVHRLATNRVRGAPTGIGRGYSPQLAEALRWACHADVRQRPYSWELLGGLLSLHAEADAQHTAYEPLPAWVAQAAAPAGVDPLAQAKLADNNSAQDALPDRNHGFMPWGGLPENRGGGDGVDVENGWWEDVEPGEQPRPESKTAADGGTGTAKTKSSTEKQDKDNKAPGQKRDVVTMSFGNVVMNFPRTDIMTIEVHNNNVEVVDDSAQQ